MVCQSAHCAHTGRVRGEMCVHWTLLGGPNYSHLVLGAGYCTERVVNGLKKSAKNNGNQWYEQSAHCEHTGRVKVKCGFCGRFHFGPSDHIWP